MQYTKVSVDPHKLVSLYDIDELYPVDILMLPLPFLNRDFTIILGVNVSAHSYTFVAPFTISSTSHTFSHSPKTSSIKQNASE